MTDKYDIVDMISSATQQKPGEFENAFSSLMLDKLRDAVEAKKVNIAQQMYGYEVPEEQPEVEDSPEETPSPEDQEDA